MSLFKKHKQTIDNAIKAIHSRTFFAQYPEHPSPKIYGEDADKEGREKFQASIGKKFEELQVEASEWVGVEESPYLNKPLGIQYPKVNNEDLLGRAKDGFNGWRKVSAEERAGILVETLERQKDRFFEIAYATMHTTGQGYMMAFQASGPHAADRSLEAIAMGFEELERFPDQVKWDKPMGKYNLVLDKELRAVPKGVGLVIGCSTFPTWNSVPGLYASLITGNSAIVKPHPGSVLPMAIVVAEIRNVLREQGFNPDICQLAVDTYDNLITKELAEDSTVKLIDFTGNSVFGSYLEALPNKAVFTEKTGVNSVILDSTDHIDKVLANIAFSISLYSGQMCTAPQNIFIPEGGVRTSEGIISFDEVAQKFAEQITGLVDNPKAGPFVLGAVQNQTTCDRVESKGGVNGKVWLESKTVENPMFKEARTASPTVIEVSSKDKDAFSKELFGPIALLIKTKSTDESIELARNLAENHGAISCLAYTLNEDIKEKVRDEMSLAATPVSFNLIGNIYVNQNAGFSDFHVSGGNPAGNASFTNPEYVIKRFTWVGFREPVMA